MNIADVIAGAGQKARSEHTIGAAMARGELDDEEAYFILRLAGALGYDAAQKRLDPRRRGLRGLRLWLVWIGGWEHSSLHEGPPIEPRWPDGRWRDPTPVSLFGHRFTYYGWGWELRLGAGHLVFHVRRRHLYWSPNGTPHHPRACTIFGRDD